MRHIKFADETQAGPTSRRMAMYILSWLLRGLFHKTVLKTVGAAAGLTSPICSWYWSAILDLTSSSDVSFPMPVMRIRSVRPTLPVTVQSDVCARIKNITTWKAHINNSKILRFKSSKLHSSSSQSFIFQIIGGVIKPCISKILKVQESQKNARLNTIMNGAAFFCTTPQCLYLFRLKSANLDRTTSSFLTISLH